MGSSPKTPSPGGHPTTPPPGLSAHRQKSVIPATVQRLLQWWTEWQNTRPGNHPPAITQEAEPTPIHPCTTTATSQEMRPKLYWLESSRPPVPVTPAAMTYYLRID
ncbi:hypothetical protein HPP92_022099 [Vanilla planifolia]|uniref:Uncharacterized protein n=1 Tax=Vanilla planifolia TaxID=51239 RepID=A0A835PVT2_VANPL|nr:hypothetical protein HPP92_022099 [Vanilla planifolia]